ncbi:hypothetical protein, partial [Arthrobacter castelli]|uniref:hypothetical protein n=1 Tax=Arthrobacter castelli TaxID=271431 RepID=UPI001B7F7CDA
MQMNNASVPAVGETSNSRSFRPRSRFIRAACRLTMVGGISALASMAFVTSASANSGLLSELGTSEPSPQTAKQVPDQSSTGLLKSATKKLGSAVPQVVESARKITEPVTDAVAEAPAQVTGKTPSADPSAPAGAAVSERTNGAGSGKAVQGNKGAVGAAASQAQTGANHKVLSTQTEASASPTPVNPSGGSVPANANTPTPTAGGPEVKAAEVADPAEPSNASQSKGLAGAVTGTVKKLTGAVQQPQSDAGTTEASSQDSGSVDSADPSGFGGPAAQPAAQPSTPAGGAETHAANSGSPTSAAIQHGAKAAEGADPAGASKASQSKGLAGVVTGTVKKLTGSVQQPQSDAGTTEASSSQDRGVVGSLLDPAEAAADAVVPAAESVRAGDGSQAPSTVRGDRGADADEVAIDSEPAKAPATNGLAGIVSQTVDSVAGVVDPALVQAETLAADAVDSATRSVTADSDARTPDAIQAQEVTAQAVPAKASASHSLAGLLDLSVAQPRGAVTDTVPSAGGAETRSVLD